MADTAGKSQSSRPGGFLNMPDLRTLTAPQAADALVKTEQFYVHKGLRVMDEIRRRLLLHSERGDEILPENVINEIFLSTEQLYDFNSGLLKKLEEARWEGTERFLCTLGEIIDPLLPYLRLYTEFVLKSRASISAVRERNEKSKTFRSFLEINEKVAGTDLFTLLSSPMNRFPQYITFLGAIHSALPPDHPAAVSLGATINKVQGIMDSISSRAENTIRRERVVQLQQNFFKNDVALVDPTRRFYRQGLVYVVKDARRKEEHSMTLFNDCILLSQKGLFGVSVKHVVQLAGIGLSLSPSAAGVENSFKLTTSLGGVKEEYWLQVCF